MRNGTKHKMMPLLLPFTICMLSRLFCQIKWQMCNRGTAVVYSYTPIKQHSVSQANHFPFQTLFISRKKYRIWNKNYPACCNFKEGRTSFVSDFSHLLRHAIEKGRGPILYSKKKKWVLIGKILS